MNIVLCAMRREIGFSHTRAGREGWIEDMGLRRPAPPETSLARLRSLESQREAKSISGSEAIVISLGKSGRTWLRILLHKALSLHFQISFDLEGLEGLEGGTKIWGLGQ